MDKLIRVKELMLFSLSLKAMGQQHTEQPESNNEGEVDQNADQCCDTRPLPAKLTDNTTTELSNQLLESKNVCLKKTVAQCQKDFAISSTCINLELQMEKQCFKIGQQKNEQLHKEKEHLKQTYKDLLIQAKGSSQRIGVFNANQILVLQIPERSKLARRDDEGCRRDPADTYDGDDDDEDENEDEDEEEEEEHLALADSVPLIHRMTARISIRDELSISLLLREEVERCSMSKELDYDITDTWDDLVGAIDEIAPTTLEGVNQRVTDLATIVEQETTSMYGIMEDAQDDREAKMARGAWGLSMDSSDYARSDVMSLCTIVVAQSALISELQSADHRRQRAITE
ncbi:hypothetical protein Tco_1001279, partial [Tanacetum coccineum]